jgi:hypothetical protein
MRSKKGDSYTRRTGRKEVGELTGGDFVAEAKEAKLVGRIAPPSVRAGGHVR